MTRAKHGGEKYRAGKELCEVNDPCEARLVKSIERVNDPCEARVVKCIERLNDQWCKVLSG